MKKIVLLVFAILNLGAINSTVKIDSEDYLKIVLNNLNKIKTATYYSTVANWAPGDTSPAFRNHYIKEYDNPTDTFVGVSFVKLLKEDTTRMIFCYDGSVMASFNKSDSSIIINDFKTNTNPFRPIKTPFFTRTKRIINYLLETKDSIRVEMKDYKDSIQFRIIIYDKIVEIIGNHIVYVPALDGSNIGEISIYDIWINKTDNLPYKIKREMPHELSIERIDRIKVNQVNIEDFTASEYFPSGVIIHTLKKNPASKNNLEGKIAPRWELKDANGSITDLNKLKSKVILVQFTGVSCGACMASIPFMKSLSADYDTKDLDFLSIEIWNKNSLVIKKYQEKNKIDYKLLMSGGNVTKDYQIQAVPVFFILDKNRVIRKIIKGYNYKITDTEIRKEINKLTGNQN
jgi:thiol-disulfide isomerase/thioredoxin